MVEVKSAVKQCKECIKHVGESGQAPLVPIVASGLMDLLHLDFTNIEVSGDSEKELKKKPKIVNMLVITDHFTHHTMAFMMEDTTALTVARVLYHHYFYIFGTPMWLMTDNDFTSLYQWGSQWALQPVWSKEGVDECLSPTVQWLHWEAALDCHQDDWEALSESEG